MVYLDHAATTPMDMRVRAAMLPYLAEEYGNPSSLYDLGRRTKIALDDARETVARVFNCASAEVIFTGSGTESDNMAIFGVARGYGNSSAGAPSYDKRGVGGVRGHLITSAIEHHAVLEPCEQLEKEGFEVTYLSPDAYGRVSAEQVAAALRPDTLLVSIMYGNNEVGTVNPIPEIARVIKEWKKNCLSPKGMGRGVLDPPFFHTDACQAAGYLSLDAKALGVDLMTVNGSKIYGPKGTGALFMRRGLKLKPLIYGGGQENRLRSGTENVAGIIGFATALHIAAEEREEESKRLIALRDYFINRLMQEIPKVVLNGHPLERLPNNVNVSILDIEGEALLLYLDEYGISASTGSACTSQTLDPSHVIVGLGKPYEFAHGSMRFSMGRATAREDVDYVMSVLPQITALLREVSPVRIDLNATDMTMKSAFAGEGMPHFVVEEKATKQLGN